MTDDIKVPEHLKDCRRCSTFYKLLTQAYSPDRGAEADADAGQGALCDNCGVSACLTGCKCLDVLCPHGRRHLREGPKTEDRPPILTKTLAELREWAFAEGSDEDPLAIDVGALIKAYDKLRVDTLEACARICEARSNASQSAAGSKEAARCAEDIRKEP